MRGFFNLIKITCKHNFGHLLNPIKKIFWLFASASFFPGGRGARDQPPPLAKCPVGGSRPPPCLHVNMFICASHVGGSLVDFNCGNLLLGSEVSAGFSAGELAGLSGPGRSPRTPATPTAWWCWTCALINATSPAGSPLFIRSTAPFHVIYFFIYFILPVLHG